MNKHDLEERLIDFAVTIVEIVLKELRESIVCLKIVNQCS
jgi:hypothetical protein